MLKVNDGRTTNERRLSSLECGDFFVWNDLLFRLIGYIGEEWANTHDDNYAVMLMTTGEITDIERDAWVEPIPDKQMHLTIED